MVRLSPEEYQVLQIIKDAKEIDFDTLVSKSDLKKDEVERITQLLKSYGFIDIKEERDKIAELTDEGKEYLENGLPERRILELVNKGITNVGDLTLKYPRANIGVIWAKKLGWIFIFRGDVELNEIGKSFVSQKHPKEIVLEKLKYPRRFSEFLPEEIEILEEFEKRGIIKTQVKKKRFIRFNEGTNVSEIEVKEEVGLLTPEIITSGKWKGKEFRKYDIRISAGRMYPGKLHPYTQIVNEIKLKLVGMGFKEFKGPLVELSFWNNDVLFMPMNHPAREVHDIFYVKDLGEGKILDKEVFENVKQTHLNGWKTGSKAWGIWDDKIAKKLLLRSQCTAVSARVLYSIGKGKIKPPLKMFVIDKVFRPDTIDAKHFIEFDQLEGIIVDEKVHLRHMLAFIEEIAKLFGATKVRFRPHYFPFTEPSVEADVYFEKFGWVEIGGAGIFRPEVTEPLGIKMPVLAWGIGIGRLAMLKLKIDDIRYLMSDDLEWIRNHKMV